MMYTNLILDMRVSNHVLRVKPLAASGMLAPSRYSRRIKKVRQGSEPAGKGQFLI
jgi:hypothetical protein